MAQQGDVMKGTNRIVLVTGSTTGIGAATARAFAEIGDTVMVSGRDEDAAKSVVAELQSLGGTAAYTLADLRKPEAAQRVVDETVRTFGKLDVLINNAGILYTASAPDTTDAQWNDTLAVNVTALFVASRAAIRQMRLQRRGVIVNVASEWGLNGEPNHVAYCTSKAAVIQMTRCMGLDHARENIRVNAVCPGEVHTRMVDAILAEQGGDPETNLRKLAAGIPMRRLASPAEVARCIRFLASDEASYVTGTTLAVDGGSDATAGAYP